MRPFPAAGRGPDPAPPAVPAPSGGPADQGTAAPPARSAGSVDPIPVVSPAAPPRRRGRSRRPGARDRPRLLRRIGLVARWPAGIALVSWRYLWRTVPMHRCEEPGGPADLPGPVPGRWADDRLLVETDGVGELLHRRYTVRVRGARLGPDEVVAALAGDPNRAAPRGVAVFVKTRGGADLQPGDEFVVRMPGPWDGPVRVVAARPAAFRLATLHGHLEAGQIEFRARTEEGLLVVEIESWARPGDRLAHLAYDRLRLAKEIQLNLWTETLLRLAACSGGRVHRGVHVHTRRVPADVVDAARPGRRRVVHSCGEPRGQLERTFVTRA